ncbi:MAG: phospholipid carrier-dependent glycosyltransferase [Chloroflexota bacterium]
MVRLRTSSWWLAAGLAGFFLCIYLLSGSSDLLHNGDTDLRFQTTQALVDHHRLWLAHPAYSDSRIAKGLGGHLYAFYGPGQIVLMAPLYIIGKAIAHHLALPYDVTTLYAARSLDLFLGALLAVLFFAFALSAGYSRRVAAILTILFGLATVAWPDAQSALEQTQVNLFLLLAVLGTWMFARARLPNRRWLALAGTGVGLAVATRYDALLYVPVLLAYVAYVRWRRGELALALWDSAWYLAATAPWLILVAAWNVLRFGSPLLTGLHEATIGNPFFLGIAELLVSPGKGLLWYLPLLFLLPFAGRLFIRRVPDLAILCVALILVPLLFYANVLYWHGDPSWGPRYLYVAVPYLILPLAEILKRWNAERNWLRGSLVVVVAISIALNVCAISVTQWRFWYRLQADQERTANAAAWTGQPFHWGPLHYHYYWNVRESPILIQIDNVYQVGRLLLGDRSFFLQAQPGSAVHSNPALLYPVNTWAFWWADVQHPLFGPRTRDAIVGALFAGALVSLLVVMVGLRREPERFVPLVAEPQFSGAGSPGN